MRCRVNAIRSSVKGHPALATILAPRPNIMPQELTCIPCRLSHRNTPHCYFARHSTSIPPCPPAMYNHYTSYSPSRARSNSLCYMVHSQADVRITRHHTPHIRPGGIQDESSKHEHQYVHERFLSQTRNTVNGMLWRSIKANTAKPDMYSCESETRAAAGHNVGSPIFAHWVEGGNPARSRKITVDRSGVSQEARGGER